jgi:CP family cyanate transporter-like MFS transporter
MTVNDAPAESSEFQVDRFRGIWHSRTAWMLALVFAVVSFNVYTMFAWLPEMLIETAGQTPLGAGALLALYSAIGFPLALFVPMIVVRTKSVSVLIYLGALAFILGYLGLLLAPALAPWLWVTLIRIGSLMFPVCLVLINLRSRTREGSVALSGFVQSIGYALAAVGPLVVGLLHGLFGGWTGAYLLLLCTVTVTVIAGFLLRRAAFVEDEISVA